MDFAYEACFSSQGDFVGVEEANALPTLLTPATAYYPSTVTFDLVGIPDYTRGAKVRLTPLPELKIS